MRAKRVAQSLAAVAVGVLVAVAGGYESETFAGIPIFVWCAALSFVVNWLVFVPSYAARTEHYYDLTGSLTYISTTILALVLVDDRDLRTVLLGVLILVWAARLGSFLFARVRSSGKDGRFDRIKHDWARFLLAWTVQGLWVIFTAAAAFAAITSAGKESFGAIGVVGLVVWVVGFATEVVADRQKSAFRAEESNEGRFVDRGLWSVSRHPNYVGEIMLWTGIAIIALPVLQGWQFVTLLSPVFVYLLLTRVSGVPMLEKRADEKWGGDPDYEAYKASTPVLFPLPFGDRELA